MRAFSVTANLSGPVSVHPDLLSRVLVCLTQQTVLELEAQLRDAKDKLDKLQQGVDEDKAVR